MSISSIGPDRKVLQEFLQDMICSATTLEQVDVLVEALMSLQHETHRVTVRMPTRMQTRQPAKALKVIHGKSGG